MILQLSGSKYSEYFFKGLCILVMVFIFFTAAKSAEMENSFNAAIPSGSASYMSSSTAPLVNPVFSDIVNGYSLSYRMLFYNDDKDLNHLLMFNIAGFSFSYSWLNNLYNYSNKNIESNSTRLASINKGFFFNNMIGFGLGYSFSKSDDDNFNHYSSFNIGFLLRPAGFMSLGFVMRDINKPSLYGLKLTPREVYSVSIRPLGEMLALSFDAERFSGERFNRKNMSLSLDVKIAFDISLYAKYSFYSNISFGAMMPFGFQSPNSSTMILDYSGKFNSDKKANMSSIGFTFTSEKYRSPIIISKSFLKIKLADEVNELEPGYLMRDKRPNFYDILKAIRESASDKNITGLLIEIDNPSIGIAQVQELRTEIKNFRRSGKKVHSVMTSPGNRGYYIATAANTICFTPNNEFTLTGLVAEVYFFKNILDKVGVKFESVSRGKYKSFNEPFTRDKMSGEYRENLTAILTDLNEQFISDICADRNIDRAKINDLFSRGLISSGEALKSGFIDAADYPDVMESNFTKVDGIVALENYLNEHRKIYEWGGLPGIAVVHVSGSIIKGKNRGAGMISPENIGDETFCQTLKEVFEDDSIRAIVIRINSGGGSAAASDFMWHSLISLRKEHKKPVVISFGNMAASGGYYIAATGDKIFASNGSITGSIGVVSGKVTLKRLYEMFGINKEVIKMSEFADIFSESRELTEKEREILQRGVDFAYSSFTQKVMDARKISKDNISKVAEGRVFTGSQAKENELVDNIGGLMAAVEYARSLSKIKKSYRVEHYPEKKATLMQLLDLASLNESFSKSYERVFGSLEYFYNNNEPAIYLYPFRVEIK